MWCWFSEWFDFFLLCFFRHKCWHAIFTFHMNSHFHDMWPFKIAEVDKNFSVNNCHLFSWHVMFFYEEIIYVVACHEKTWQLAYVTKIYFLVNITAYQVILLELLPWYPYDQNSTISFPDYFTGVTLMISF